MLKTVCSDKILVREYCKNKLGIDLFIPILKIYDKFDDINFKELPKNYVLKTNHGSHTNIIVKNGNININDARKKFNLWMSKDWSWYGKEMAYFLIDRKIFAEKFMQDKTKGELTDYKFLCFNGSPKFCQVINNRNTSNYHINYYNMNFQFVDINRADVKNDKNHLDKKPENFEKMKEYSKILSKDFKFIRIDFYEIEGKLYLSELTFFPGSGFLKYKDEKTDLFLGNLLHL